MRSLDWQDWSACTPNDAAAFTVTRKPHPQEMARLWGICFRCPVIQHCAIHALDDLHSGELRCGFYAGVYIPDRGNQRDAARTKLMAKAGVE